MRDTSYEFPEGADRDSKGGGGLEKSALDMLCLTSFETTCLSLGRRICSHARAVGPSTLITAATNRASLRVVRSDVGLYIRFLKSARRSSDNSGHIRETASATASDCKSSNNETVSSACSSEVLQMDARSSAAR